jgi:GDSL-like Lipase/Acylhydrolase family
MFKEHVTLRFRACSGARIPDMFQTQKTAAGGASLGPQLRKGVLGPRVGLVTVTIGGNDLGFSKVLKFCMSNHPRFLRFIPRPQGQCLNEEFEGSGLSLEAWAKRKLSQLGPREETLFEQLRAEAPNARIIVLGYPNIFWTQFGGGTGEFDKDCVLDPLFLSDGEVNGLLDVESAFNGMEERMAHQAGIEFISTTSTFLGHEPCGRDTPRWMDYITLGGGEGGLVDLGSMHPNRNGQYILARLISCYLSVAPDAAADDQLSDCARSGKHL